MTETQAVQNISLSNSSQLVIAKIENNHEWNFNFILESLRT